MNLVLNAVDAMPDGGELALCTERVEPGDGSAAGARAGVVVVVRDSGAGIATDDLPRIFDPFFTTKAPGRGTGLGLSSVHGIVSAAAGRVEVESEPGRGTTFRVHLPAADRATGSVSPAAPARRESGGRATILVCEDEAPVRRVTRRALEVAGHVVHEVDCGESALRWLQEHDEPVDLLISDVVMPGINGRELAARVQAERPGVRVLLVSGYASDVLATGDGGPDFELLEKPFTPETLRRRVEVVLAGAGGVSP